MTDETMPSGGARRDGRPAPPASGEGISPGDDAGSVDQAAADEAPWYEVDLSDRAAVAELVRNREAAFGRDRDWRDNYLGIDFDRSVRLYEGSLDDKDNPESSRESRVAEALAQKQGRVKYSRVNLIRRAVDQNTAVLYPNVPRVTLEAERRLAPSSDPVLRELQAFATEETERTANGYLRAFYHDNRHEESQVDAIHNAGVFGFGAYLLDVDESADLAHVPEVADLIEKAENGEAWDEDDAARWEAAARRITSRSLYSPYVFFQSGVRRRTDGDFNRFSVIDPRDTGDLRRVYRNKDIQPCTSGTYHTETIPEFEGELSVSHKTSVITTYEVVRFTKTIPVPGSEDDEGKARTITVTDANLVKTVFAGGQLLSHEVFTSRERPIRLPVFLVYVAESLRSLYGYSLTRALERSEEFINRYREMLFRAGERSVRSGAVAIWTKHIGANDRRQIQGAIKNGGVAWLEGNMIASNVDDIRKVVMPLPGAGAPLDPGLAAAAAQEYAAFGMESGAPDEKAVGRTRSAAGKRTQLTFADRLKTVSILSLGRAEKEIAEAVWDWRRVLAAGEEAAASVDVPGEGRWSATLNLPYKAKDVPVVDAYGDLVLDTTERTEAYPLGVPKTRDLEVTVNDTRLVMRGRTSSASGLPLDPAERRRILATDLKMQAITPHTYRHFVLDPAVRDFDDFVRRRMRAEAEKQAELETARMQLMQRLARAGGYNPEAAAEGQPPGVNVAPFQSPDRQPPNLGREAFSPQTTGMMVENGVADATPAEGAIADGV